MATIELGKTAGTINGGEVASLEEINTANAMLPQVETTPQVVNATDIGAAPTVVPAPPKTNIADQLASIEQQALAIQEKINRPSTEQPATQPVSVQDAIMQQLMGLSPDGEVSAETMALQESAASANLLAQNLQTDITAYTKATRDEVNRMRQNPEGKLAGSLAAQIENYEYERYSQKDGLADMAIAAQYALNNAQYANELASNAVAAEERQFDKQISYLNTLYNMSLNDMTASESMQFQSQLRMYENQVTQWQDAKQTALQNAAANNAPVEVITAIRNAKTMDEVWQSAGSYGVDPNISLNRQKFAWDQWYAMRKLQLEEQANQGLLSQAAYNKIIQTEATRKELGKSVQAVEDILNNSLGFGAATGKVTGGSTGFFDLGLRTGAVGAAGGAAFGPIGALVGGTGGLLFGGFFGASEAKEQQGNIAMNMDYIEAALTTQRIGYAKNLGLTGAMSDKDIELIGNSADKLVSSWDKETMTFSKGEPAEVEKALTELKATLIQNQEILLFDPEYQSAILGTDANEIDNQFQ